MIYLLFVFSIITFSFHTTTASDHEEEATTHIPGNVLRAYPTLRGTHALHTGDAAPASDDDTGYDTLSSRGALSSQSSLAAQIGTQDTLATPFNPVPMPTVPVISPSKPDDDLLVDIRALAAQGAFIFTTEERQSVEEMGALVLKKRIFSRHLKSYMILNFSNILSKKQIEGFANSFAYNIRHNQENYWARKKNLFTKLRTIGITQSQLEAFDEEVMRPREEACKLCVQQCAETVTVFGTGTGRSPMRRLSRQRKLASHKTLGEVVSRLSAILDGIIA